MVPPSVGHRVHRSAAQSVFAAATLALVTAFPTPGRADVVAASPAGTSVLEQALAYEHGEGVGKDLPRAAALYCEAAREGDPEAQFALGWMYANGRGLPRDDAAAASLFGMAADAGHRQAAKMLVFVGDKGKLPECMRPRPIEELVQVKSEPVVLETALEPLDPFAELSPAKRKIADAVEKLAARFAIEPRLALAIVAVESNFQPGARSPKDARGLMQLIPETAARFNVRDSYNASDNVRGGLTYLRWLLSYYQGQVALALAAYNAGEKAVDRHRGIPPYAETRDYVRRILQLYGSDRHPYDARIATPSPVVAGGVPGPS
jgi:hypothetical protein